MAKLEGMPDCTGRYWGKAGEGDKGWHPVVLHGLDVAATLHALLHGSPQRLNHMARCCDLSAEALSSLACLFAALHDIGKFSLHFQLLRPELSSRLLEAKLPARMSSLRARHDRLSQYFFRNALIPHLLEMTGETDKRQRRQMKNWLGTWGRIACGHHGAPVSEGQQADTMKNSFAHKALSPTPREAALAWTDHVIALLCPDLPKVLCEVGEDGRQGFRSVSWELAGWMTLADWIGSDEKWFPYCPERCSPTEYWEARALPAARDAVAAAGILPCPTSPSDAGPLFPEMIDTLRPLQAHVMDATLPTGPQLWILEDITGSGKTEAFLLLAQRLFQAGVANRLFIGLPTMATANAMLVRIEKVWQKLYAPDASPSLVLAHSNRRLVKEMREVFTGFDGMESEPLGDDLRCSAWLADNNRKSLWAHVGVGTIDQALLSALRIRHQPLRHAGLSGSLLVVDEVHACDPYMGALLQGVLRNHARGGGSAILLTATLASGQKDDLCRAFREGLGGPAAASVTTDNYPAVTVVSREEEQVTAVEACAANRREVHIDFLDSAEAVAALVTELVADGACVAWVRNTVSDVEDGAECLREILGERAGVMTFHSRFLMGGRLQRENEVLACFGPESGGQTRRGKVLVASQVIEQSLDLDFDWMISDLAPVDLLVQRLGRLRRHHRHASGERLPVDRPDGRGAIRFHVFAPPLTGEPTADWYSEVFPGGSRVYPDVGMLWRTAQTLKRLSPLRFPEMSRDMIESVHGAAAKELPAGLTGASGEAGATRKRQQSLGQDAVLDTAYGYGEASCDWADDESRYSPGTRLEEYPKRRVYFGVARQGAVLPVWEATTRSEQSAWEFSSAELPVHLLDGGTAGVVQARGPISVRGMAVGPVLVCQENDHGNDRWAQITKDDGTPVSLRIGSDGKITFKEGARL